MNLDLAELEKMGGFVPKEPVKTEVSWTPPEGDTLTFTVFVKRLSGGAMERLWANTQKDDDRARSAMLLSEAVLLGEKGEQKLTYDKAWSLEMTLMSELLDAVDRVNPHKKRTVETAKN